MKRVLSLFFVCIFLTSCDHDNGSATGPQTSGDFTQRTATVTYVYDGDTIQVNGTEKVRYIGIDTPERDDCFFWEATLRNRELVDERTVLLEICSESPVDQYGRTLAHVSVDDSLVNATLLNEGYARALRIPPCTSRADYYQQLEDEAQNSGKGMWSACD